MSVVNNCKTFNEENTINEKCFINLLNTEFGNNNNNNISNNKQETRAPPVWLTDENDESTSYSPIKNLAVRITKSPSHDKLLQRSPKTPTTGTTKISRLIYANDDEKLNIRKQKTIVRSRHTYKTDYKNEINNITPSFTRSILVNSPSAIITSPKSPSKSLPTSPHKLEKEYNVDFEGKKSVEVKKSTNKIAKFVMNTDDEESVSKKISDESIKEPIIIQFEKQNINDFSLVFNNENKIPKESHEPLMFDNNATTNELKLNLENIIPTTRVNKFNPIVDVSPVIPVKKTENYPPITKAKEADKMSNDILLKSNKSNDENLNRQKSHDRIETRRYMKEQQKKRAQVHKKDNQQEKINKDIIKERLSKLKTNTRKIVNNNVKKTTKKKEKNENVEEQCVCTDVPVTSADDKLFRKTISDKIIVKKPIENKKPEENHTIENNNKNNKILHLSPYFKRKFGILRRQEDNSETFPMQRKIFKTENNAGTVDSIPIENDNTDKLSANDQKLLNNTSEIDKSTKIELNSNILENPDTDLKAPEVKLNISKTLQNDVTNIIEEVPIEENKDDLPYWLRPSAVQIYPYNFIMAVRKKLEAITNPVIHLNEKTATSANNDFKLKISKLLDNVDNKGLKNVKSEEMLDEIANIPSLNKNKMPNRMVSVSETIQNKVLIDNNVKSSSGCGLTTNFSSISLNLPQSNTISDISSIKSDYDMLTSTPVHNLHTNIKKDQNTSMELNENNDSDTDDTLRTTNSISSVIFSYDNNRHELLNLQQKKNDEINDKILKSTVSPLSITNIADMRIKSSFLNDTNIKKEEEVSTSIDEIILIEKQERGTKEYRNEEVQTENIEPGDDMRLTGFHKMLEAFNQSLSHVIEVNQQLYSALHGPSKTGITTPATRSTKENDSNITAINNLEQTLITTRSIAYTDDFEQQVTSQDEFLDIINNSKQFCNENANKTLNSNEIEEELVKSINSTISKSSTNSRSDLKIKASNLKKNLNQANNNELSETIKTYSNKENSSSRSQYTDIVMRNNDNKINQQQEDMEELLIQTEKSLIFNNENSGDKYLNNLSIGSDIFAVFNRNNCSNNNIKGNYSDIELSSFMSATTILSETIQSNLSYSNIGMYEKMITAEKTKTEHLTYLMKLREKSIIDRTKGQLAWLELQKIKLKEKSLGNEEIKIIKKKQRALLVRLEKERKAIRREIKLQSDLTQTTNTPKKHLLNTSIDDLSTRVVSLKRSLALKLAKPQTKTAMKGYEIIGGESIGNSLERILEKREKELRERRDHVENLIKWHQRLDNEEQEVIEIENLLMGYNVKKLGNKNNQHAIISSVNNNIKANSINSNEDEEKKKLQKKLNKIEKSLNILKNISTTSIDDEDRHEDISNASNCTNKSKLNEDYVQTSGERMNKLWMRLTNRNETKFERKKMYKFSKSDLENFYEEAKKVIFRDFFHINNSKDTTSNTLNSITNLFTETSDIANDVIIADLVGHENTKNLSLLNLNANDGESSHKSDGNDNNYYFNSDESVHTGETIKTDETPTITNKVVKTTEVISENISDNKNEKSNQIITEVIINDTKDVSNEPLMNDIDEVIEEISDSTGVENPNETFTYTTPTVSTITDIISPRNELDANSFTNSEENVTTSAITEDVEANSNSDSSRIQTDDNLNTTIILNEIKTFELKIKNLEDVEEILFNNSDRDDNHQDDNNESTELEKRLINIDDSLKNLNETFEKVPIMDFDGKLLSPDSVLSLYSNKDIIEGLDEDDDDDDTFFDEDDDTSEIKSIEINEENSIDELISPPSQPPVSFADISNLDDDDEDKENQMYNQLSPSTSAQLQNKALQREYNNKKILISNRMPDIISEAEVLRRQQQQIKTSEQDTIPNEQSGYVFLREIPNKPPPPYVPPAHGSPLTALFPSEERIAEIIYRRTEELYNSECNKADTSLLLVTTGASVPNQPSSILNENITNIYEKIILDVCFECFNDIDIKSINDGTSKHSKTYKSQLKFYNPPDKLKCIQEYILKRVKKLLNVNSGVSAKNNNSPTNNKSNLLFNNFNYNNNRRKRDHVDVILVDELFEDEHKWINYDLEEEIVLNNVIDEILKSLLHNTLIDVENVFNAKQQL